MPQAKTEVALQFSECCAAEVALQHSLFYSVEVISTKNCTAANEKLHCNFKEAALQKSGAFLPLPCGFQAPTFRHPRLGLADRWGTPKIRGQELWKSGTCNSEARKAKTPELRNSETTVFVVSANSTASWTIKLVSWEVGAPDLRQSKTRNSEIRNSEIWNSEISNSEIWNSEIWNSDLELRSGTPKSGTPKFGAPKLWNSANPRSGTPKIWDAQLRNQENPNSRTQEFRNHCFCSVCQLHCLLNNQACELRSWSSWPEEFRN